MLVFSKTPENTIAKDVKTGKKTTETQPKEVENQADVQQTNKVEELNVDNDKEKVFDENHPFVESDVNKSAPLNQQPTQSVPTFNINK